MGRSAAALNNWIASLITIIFQVLYSRIAQKKPTNKILSVGLIVYYYLIKL